MGSVDAAVGQCRDLVRCGVRTLVLDAGALIALERRDRRMLALLDELLARRCVAHVPSGIVAQVWRGSPRQHAIGRLLRTDAVKIQPLSEALGFHLGLLLATSGGADVIDAHVAALAKSTGAVVITSDPDDIQAIEAQLDVVVV